MHRLYAAAAAAVLALSLTACGQKETLTTLDVGGNSEVEEVFSLARALDLGAGFLSGLDSESAILQYTEILRHDPENKAAYAGLYAAYAAQDQTEQAEQVLEDAQDAFGDEGAIVDEILADADLIFAGGGGSAPYRHLSDWYLGLPLVGADELYKVGNAWLQAEPGSIDPYAVLGVYYAGQDDAEQLDGLVALAEENGLDLNEIDAEIRVKSNGDYTIEMQIEGLTEEPVEVEIDKEDDAQDVVQKVTQEVAAGAASEVVDQSGLTGEAADMADQLAQEAIRQGLSALPGGFNF